MVEGPQRGLDLLANVVRRPVRHICKDRRIRLNVLHPSSAWAHVLPSVSPHALDDRLPVRLRPRVVPVVQGLTKAVLNSLENGAGGVPVGEGILTAMRRWWLQVLREPDDDKTEGGVTIRHAWPLVLGPSERVGSLTAGSPRELEHARDRGPHLRVLTADGHIQQRPAIEQLGWPADNHGLSGQPVVAAPVPPWPLRGPGAPLAWP